MKKIIMTVTSIVVFLGLWELLVVILKEPAIVSLKSISGALTHILADFEFYKNLGQSLSVVFFGVLIAFILAIIVGIIVDISVTLKYLIMPIVNLLRNIPSIALFPLIIVLLGIGNITRIFIIFWCVFPPILLTIIHSFNAIDKDIIEASKIEGFNKLELAILIKLPIGLVEIINGLKIGVGTAFITIVVAEMLGANSGLGYMILWSTNVFKYDYTYAYILIVAFIGLILSAIISLISKIIERKII